MSKERAVARTLQERVEPVGRLATQNPNRPARARVAAPQEPRLKPLALLRPGRALFVDQVSREIADHALDGVQADVPLVCELRSASEALEVTLAPEASSAGGPTPANDAVRKNERVELAAAARALADKHTLKKLQTLARGKGLQIKGSKLAVAERLVQAG